MPEAFCHFRTALSHGVDRFGLTNPDNRPIVKHKTGARKRQPNGKRLKEEAIVEVKTIQVYDKAMCCSTGVCGPQVDPVLPRFAADLDWLGRQGHAVSRFNLAQNPAEFAKHEVVKKMLADEGVECLPLILVDGTVVSRSEYPSRENLALWTGSKLTPKATLPVADKCCGDSGCC